MPATEKIVETAPEVSLGETLRGAREKRGLNVEECATRLFIPASTLTALEANQFADLGPSVYARGHLRRYAGFLELDVAELERQMLQHVVTTPDLTAIVTLRPVDTGQPRRLGRLPVALLLLVFSVLAALWWWSERHGAIAAAVPEPAAESAQPVSVPATTGAETSVAPQSDIETAAGAVSSASAPPASVQPTSVQSAAGALR
jgi:cytoskeleton protein RodZ